MDEMITYLKGMQAALEFANSEDAEMLQELLDKILKKAEEIENDRATKLSRKCTI